MYHWWWKIIALWVTVLDIKSPVIMRTVLWRSGWMLTNWGQLRWIDDWIIKWRRHRNQPWWQLIALLVTVLAIKAPVITRSVLWRYGWLLTNRGQLRWIDEWIIKWTRNRYHRWWQLVDLCVNLLTIKALVITRSCSLPTLIAPCSTFVSNANNLWTWHDGYHINWWWCCVPVILFVDGQQKVWANVLERQLQSCLIFSTRNKIDYEFFVST